MKPNLEINFFIKLNPLTDWARLDTYKPQNGTLNFLTESVRSSL